MGIHHNPVYESIDEEKEEEDAFYQEIRRQILVLTEDDDDFFESRHRTSVTAAFRQKGLKRSTLFETQLAGRSYSDNGGLVPTCLVNLWRNGNRGTGVFIPHIVNSRRRHSSGKKNSGNRKICKQVDEDK